MHLTIHARLLSGLTIALLVSWFALPTRSSAQSLLPSTGTPHKNAALPASNIPPVSGAPYRLQPGDVIEIRLFYNPELNDQVQIRPDGRVSLQLIGDVELASKSIPEAVSILERKYIEQVRTPEVTLQIKSYASQKVYVVGEVQHPGMLNLPGPMTVYDAISEAGGMKLTANQRVAVLLRKGSDGSPEGQRLVLFNHGALSPDASIVLGPFDVVMVPESKTARLDRWVDQTIRQMAPFIMSAGFNYLLTRQTGLVPIY